MKTISLKKVSAVAVASLGFGLLSVVPAQAAAAATVTVGSPVRTGPGTYTVAVTLGVTGADDCTTTADGTGYVLTAGATTPLAAVAPATGVVSFATNSTTAGSTAGATTGKADVTVAGTITITSATNTNVANVAALAGSYTGKIKLAGPSGCDVTESASTTITIAASTTGSFIAPVAATVTTNNTVAQAVNGQATFKFIQGTGDTSYTVTSSGPGTILSTTATTTAPTNLNGLTPAGGVSWSPATTVQQLTVVVTSSIAGVQTLTFQPITAATGAPGIALTATVTWGGAITFAPTSTVVRQQPTATAANIVAGDAQGSTSATTYNFTTTLNAITPSNYKTAGNALSVIEVVTLNSDGSAAYQGNVVSASITGSGLISASTTAPTAATAPAVTGASRATTVTLDASKNVAWIYASTDGTAGTGTVTISVTDAVTGATTVVGSRSFITYGAVAKLSVASSNYTVGRAGYTTGGASATQSAAGSVANPLDTTVTDRLSAFVIKAEDSAGSAVTTTAVPTIVSSDVSVVTGGTCVLDAGSATYGSSTNGVGYYNCNFTTAANAKSGAKATLTIRVLNPADTSGTTYLTTTVPVTVGEKVATTTLSTDKKSYAPGEAMIVTAKAVDASGNPVYDGAASVVPTSSKALGGTALSSLMTGFYVGGVDASSTTVAKAKVFAPAQSGSFVLTGTDSTLATVSATASVTDANAGLLTQIDALNAKIVALNALIAKIMKKLGVK